MKQKYVLKLLHYKVHNTQKGVQRNKGCREGVSASPQVTQVGISTQCSQMSQ